jgi:hypothetical protein
MKHINQAIIGIETPYVELTHISYAQLILKAVCFQVVMALTLTLRRVCLTSRTCYSPSDKIRASFLLPRHESLQPH